MALKNSSALLAVLLAAAPAMSFAQTAETPATPVTEAPVTEAPATEAPATQAPATEATTTEAPATEAPATTTPAAETPAAETPAAETPAAETPATPAAQAPAAAAPAAESPAQPMPMIAPNAESAQVGQAYQKEVFGDWQMRCLKTELSSDPCELFQELKNAQGTPISQVTFSAVEAGDVVSIATVMMPLETDLLQGLTMQIDTGKEQKIPFATCVPVGCMARIALSNNDLGLFKRGNEAKITVMPFLAPPEAKETVALSLKGFTAGIDAVTTANKAANEAAKAAGATQGN